MTAIALHQSGFFLKSTSNCSIILLAQIDYMYSLTRALERFLVLRPSFLSNLSMWHGRSTKFGSQKIAATSRIVLTMQASLCSRSFICYGLFKLTTREYLHLAKLRSNSFWTWLLANAQVLMKVLSNILLPISLDEKKGRTGVPLARRLLLKLPFWFFCSKTLLITPFYFFRSTH